MSIRSLTSSVFIFVVLLIARPITAFAADAPSAKPTVAVFTLTGSVTESPAGESFPLFEPPSVSLRELTGRMTKAAQDPAVKAVVLLSENASLGSAQVEEVRQSIANLRAANKDVLVHSDTIGATRDYVLFSGATRLSASPTAILWVGGLYAEQPYLRGLLDKLGVQPDFLTCGDYKSAAEIFTRTEPSKQADEMTNWLLDSMFQTHLDLIARGRNVAPDKAKAWIDTGLYTAEKAKAAGLIDAVEHRQDFTAFVKSKYGNDVQFDKKYGKPKQPQIDFSNPFALFKVFGDLFGGGQKPKPTQPAVGIVYVEGPILLGSPQPSIFDMSGSGAAYSSALRKALDQAAADDTIKAVVLRVNSPGGSATASEIILDAAKRVKAKKPFVVSMGNVAGSGGYYVACAADTIFADASTITASIGVVSGKLVTTPMWNKIGITFKPYARGQNADLFSSSHPFTPAERAQMQSFMDEIYGVFKQHVADARGRRLKKPLDEITGGRVYTGRQALELGLVDQIGSLNDAVAYVAREAKMPENAYDVRPVPEPKNFLEQLMEQSGGGGDPRDLAALRTVGAPSILQLALPHLQNLDPRRVAIIRQALVRLDLIGTEGAVLMMPEFAAP